MDATLFSNYEDNDAIMKQCIDLINEAENKNGVLTLLWHQRVFNENEFPNWSRIYEEIIKECKKRGAYFGRCIDIYKWCLKNE